MVKLQRLDVANEYMDLMTEVDRLHREATGHLKTSPQLAIEPYRRLRSLVTAVRAAQPAAEGAAPHLVDHVEQQANKLYASLRDGFEDDLQKSLEKMKWPVLKTDQELNLPEQLVLQWTQQVEVLLDLQEPDLTSQAAEALVAENGPEPPLLLPLGVMAKPLEMRFRYHFYGDKPTNRLDKPEYFLSHFIDQLDLQRDFIIDYLQPVLDVRTRAVDMDESIYTDALSAFITALLPMLTTKCLTLLPQVANKPQLFSHFIHELMSFDSTLREEWSYAPVAQAIFDWKGLTWLMLTTHGYFNAWLQVEKEFALSRYMTIRDAAESNEQDFDSTPAGSTVPTKGAIRVNDLVESVTDRYRSLTSFSQKLKFLIDIQLAIFDDYYQHLRESFQSYQVNSTIAGKFVQNPSLKEDPSTDVSGIRGLQTLSKVFGSAEYLEKKMLDWSDDVFFLELWDELQDRASRNANVHGTVGRDLMIRDVASKTSATIVQPNQGDQEADGSDGALFDETATAYRGLRISVENEMTEALRAKVRGTLRTYIRGTGWSSLSGTVSDASQLSPTASLDSTLQLLAAQLGFLSRILAIGPLRRITRQVCQAIQKDMLDNIVSRQSFSTAGVSQIRRDIIALESIIDSTIKVPGEAGRCMRKLGDALTLLGLPIKSSSSRTTQDGEEFGWDFDEDTNANSDSETPNTPEEDKVWGLWEVEKLIFKSNESARQVLSDMHLDTLSETEARTILKRRVELGS